ncbi:MAG: helix-hairpin-helix domain-containing protein [Patescibacteria group bacterium]|jgi:DNA polymerase (family 10)
MYLDKENYTNTEIGELLENIATAYEIKNKNYFRIVSYQNAAETIYNQTKSIQKLWQKDKNLLDELPGIGESILKKLDYLFTHHQLPTSVLKTFSGIHPVVFTFTKITGIGPKTAHKLTNNLKFSEDPENALEELIDYAQAKKIRNFPDFGEKSEELILENTLNFMGRKRRMKLVEAENISQKIINYLSKKFPNTEFIPLGSLRRQASSVGDIDIAAKSDQTEEILNHFIDYPENIQTITKGPKKASIKIKNDIRIDLMVQPPQTFGSLLQHFTGSRQHNILLRRYAQNLGFSLSEYGIKDLRSGKIHHFENEKDFYNFLKLCYIEPPNRIGENEIEEAQKCYTKSHNS